MQKTKVIFFGSPSFAATLLSVIANHCEVLAVCTQPPRPANRGKQLTPTPVYQLAASNKIPILQPEKWDEHSINQLRQIPQPDLIITAAYKNILLKEILEYPRQGCINVHYSLLPKWRGAAPVQRAIIAGNPEVGISLMNMEETLDTGSIIIQQELKLNYENLCINNVYIKLTDIAVQLLVKILPYVGNIRSIPQKHELATYAPKITKEEMDICWQDDAALIYRKIIAYGGKANFQYNNTRILVHSATISSQNKGTPGTEISPKSFNFFCGQGSLQIQKAQREGGIVMNYKEILNGIR